MEKNLNYNYENRSVSRTTSVLANVEMTSCKKADLSRLKVTNGNFYHTTDTNEFFYDWGGKRNKLNVLGGDQNIQSEIDKIKDTVAKLDTKKMDSLEEKVNTAVQTVNGVKSDVADAVKKANEASKTAQDAANAVTDKASKSDIDEAIAKIDLTGYAKKSEIPSLDNYATKDEIPSLDNYATKDELPSVEGFIKSGDLVDYAKKSEIPSLDGYATKDEIPSVEGFLKAENLAGYAKKSDIPSLDNYATKDEIPSLDAYAKKEDIPSVEGFIKSGDLVDYAKKSEIPSLDNYATKDEIPSVEGFLKAEDLTDYAKTKDIPNPLVNSVDDSEATQTKVQFGVDETGKLTGSIAAYDVDGAVQSKINDLNLDSKYAPAGSLDGKQDKLSDDQLAALDKVNTLNLDGKQDTLANADVLSKITAEEVTAWNGKQDTLANADVLSNITTEQVAAWNGKQDTITTVTLPTDSISNDWDGELATLDQDGYVKANDLIKYVEAAILKKKSDEVGKEYFYVNGYKNTDEKTNIYTFNCYQLDFDENNEYSIEVLFDNEISGWSKADGAPLDQYAQYVTIDVPSGYGVTLMKWNDETKSYSDDVNNKLRENVACNGHKTIAGVKYDSYVRGGIEDSQYPYAEVLGFDGSEWTYNGSKKLYLITITKK